MCWLVVWQLAAIFTMYAAVVILTNSRPPQRSSSSPGSPAARQPTSPTYTASSRPKASPSTTCSRPSTFSPPCSRTAPR